ncbi:MAG: hypothetical protein DI556_09765 [Rhodovulum sulfidophilum]|uniref:Uncharacterized protein n=1 Tax=Rhodovulum sulfidophilum TaxID=35806 RepID=A0A2W5NB24_RHOSU|nr:MAG: hypothetical protein DI556_09765 [Rhodovulum sulfidophilum]
MPKIVVSNSSTTPLTIFTRFDIPVGSGFDLAAAAVEALERDPVIKALMGTGMVAIEDQEEPAAADSLGITEIITPEPAKAPESDEKPADLAAEAITPAEATPPATPEPEADAAPAEPAATAEPKAEKRTSTKKPAAGA